MNNRLLGAILLIAGTTIGAAMLALPVSTGRAGFLPSLVAFSVIWVYLTYAALCVLEVALSLPKDSNIVTMAEHTLGSAGKWLSSAAYLFLLYALNTAYLSATISLFQDITFQLTGYLPPKILCALPQLGIFYLLLRKGISMIDTINRIGMIGLFSCFSVLILLSLPHIALSNLQVVEWQYLLPSLSIVLTAFGFHIVSPSLVSYLDGNVRQLKTAIFVGSSVPFVAYILWQIATLGIVPATGPRSIQTAYETGTTGSQLLAVVTDNTFVAGFDEMFAFCAIITSFLGVSMSLFDFLVDGLKLRPQFTTRWKIGVLAFLPPLYFALAGQRVFLSALEYAGAFGVVILLALIPTCMVWRKRYVLHLPSKYEAPGGKCTLAGFMLLSLSFIALEILLKMAPV